MYNYLSSYIVWSYCPPPSPYCLYFFCLKIIFHDPVSFGCVVFWIESTNLLERMYLLKRLCLDLCALDLKYRRRSVVLYTLIRLMTASFQWSLCGIPDPSFPWPHSAQTEAIAFLVLWWQQQVI